MAEIAPLWLASAADLAFGKNLEQIINSKSVIILCPLELDTPIEEKVLICVDNPRLWFIHIMKKFFHIPRPRIPGLARTFIGKKSNGRQGRVQL